MSSNDLSHGDLVILREKSGALEVDVIRIQGPAHTSHRISDVANVDDRSPPIVVGNGGMFVFKLGGLISPRDPYLVRQLNTMILFNTHYLPCYC